MVDTRINKLLAFMLFWSVSLSPGCSKDTEEIAINPDWNNQIIAHRGYWKYPGGVQNSIASLHSAIDLGIRGAEFDIAQTLDDSLVLSHDLEYMNKPIGSLTYEELKSRRAENNEPLHTLDELLRESHDYPQFRLMLDIKDADPSKLLSTIRKHDAMEKIDFLSFSIDYCQKLASYGAECRVSYLDKDIAPDELLQRGLYGAAYHVHAYYAYKKSYTFGSLKTYVWVVNDRKTLRDLIKNKVDYIITDYPDLYEMPN